eukprot:9481565-Pyramimonas_sp.AAC.1
MRVEPRHQVDEHAQGRRREDLVQADGDELAQGVPIKVISQWGVVTIGEAVRLSVTGFSLGRIELTAP